MKNKSNLLILTTTLAISGLFGLSSNITKTIKRANAEVRTIKIDFNENLSPRYRCSSNNPTSWSSYNNVNDAQGQFMVTDLPQKTWNEFSNESSSPLKITGKNTYKISVSEEQTCTDCIGLYLPVVFKAVDVPAYSRARISFNIKLSLGRGSTGGYTTGAFVMDALYSQRESTFDPSTYETAYLLGIAKDEANIVKTGDEAICVGNGAGVGSGSYSNGTRNIPSVTAINRTNQPADIPVFYGAIYIGARASSNAHKFDLDLEAEVESNISDDKLVLRDSNGNYYYEDQVSTAFSNLSVGGTLTVLNDFIWNRNIEITKNTVLDLNGKTLQMNNGSKITVADRSRLDIQGSGTLKGFNSSSFIENAGILTVANNSEIYNMSGQGSTVLNSGTFTTSGTIRGYVGITANGGTVNINGGAIRATSITAIALDSGNLYLSNTPSVLSNQELPNKHTIVLDPTNAFLFGQDANRTAFYDGETINVYLNKTVAPNTVVVDRCSDNKFAIVNVPSTGYEYRYSARGQNISYAPVNSTLRFRFTNVLVNGEEFYSTVYAYGQTAPGVNITAKPGYIVPSQINVARGATVLTEGTDYTYIKTSSSEAIFTLLATTSLNEIIVSVIGESIRSIVNGLETKAQLNFYYTKNDETGVYTFDEVSVVYRGYVTAAAYEKIGALEFSELGIRINTGDLFDRPVTVDAPCNVSTLTPVGNGDYYFDVAINNFPYPSLQLNDEFNVTAYAEVDGEKYLFNTCAYTTVFELAKAYQNKAASLGLTDLQIELIDAFIKQMF